jgi:HPt (histidine-containing phosphotransfer) domain-containing protein
MLANGVQGRGVQSMTNHSGPAQGAEGDDNFTIAVLVERLDGDEEIAREVAEAFLESSREILESLESAVSANDVDKVRLHAHSIKGAAANIGANALAAAAGTVEDAGRDADLETAKQALPGIRSRCERVFAVLEAWS